MNTTQITPDHMRALRRAITCAKGWIAPEDVRQVQQLSRILRDLRKQCVIVIK